MHIDRRVMLTHGTLVTHHWFHNATTQTCRSFNEVAKSPSSSFSLTILKQGTQLGGCEGWGTVGQRLTSTWHSRREWGNQIVVPRQAKSPITEWHLKTRQHMEWVTSLVGYWWMNECMNELTNQWVNNSSVPYGYGEWMDGWVPIG